ncbi:MAG: 50S ribosomal protein L24 [Magnetococcales bacterium]|nr:50S ribosomal protein L24 [Magnetococcales bacterium]|tara:strand:+ start:5713 stop:6045 length:333 start_codon:yes stop_codon:yes gene_type:complete
MTRQFNSYLKTGDNVIVTAGKEKGKTGVITKVLTKEDRVIVGGLNMVKRHQRPMRMGDEAGIINKEAPIHVSNVMIADPKTGEATRIGFKTLKDGKKVRFAKKSGQELDK